MRPIKYQTIIDAVMFKNNCWNFGAQT